MSEFPKPEQLSRRERSRAARISDIIHAITDRHRVILPIEPIKPIEPIAPIEHIEVGFNMMGDYVTRTVIERPDAGQLDKTTRNWDVV